MKVFVVTTGIYSDYRIHSIWTTKEKAKKMKAILHIGKYNPASIEEFEIDKECPEKAGFCVTLSYETGQIMPAHKAIVEMPEVRFWGSDKSIIYAKHFTEKKAVELARKFRAAEKTRDRC